MTSSGSSSAVEDSGSLELIRSKISHLTSWWCEMEVDEGKQRESEEWDVAGCSRDRDGYVEGVDGGCEILKKRKKSKKSKRWGRVSMSAEENDLMGSEVESKGSEELGRSDVGAKYKEKDGKEDRETLKRRKKSKKNKKCGGDPMSVKEDDLLGSEIESKGSEERVMSDVSVKGKKKKKRMPEGVEQDTLMVLDSDLERDFEEVAGDDGGGGKRLVLRMGRSEKRTGRRGGRVSEEDGDSVGFGEDVGSGMVLIDTGDIVDGVREVNSDEGRVRSEVPGVEVVEDCSGEVHLDEGMLRCEGPGVGSVDDHLEMMMKILSIQKELMYKLRRMGQGTKGLVDDMLMTQSLLSEEVGHVMLARGRERRKDGKEGQKREIGLEKMEGGRMRDVGQKAAGQVGKGLEERKRRTRVETITGGDEREKDGGVVGLDGSEVVVEKRNSAVGATDWGSFRKQVLVYDVPRGAVLKDLRKWIREAGKKLGWRFESEEVKGSVSVVTAMEVYGGETLHWRLMVVGKVGRMLLRVGKLVNMQGDEMRVREWRIGTQCFRCLGYGHQVAVCRKDVVCVRCGEGHLRKDCGAVEPRCVNCVRGGKDGVEARHAADWEGCPVAREWGDKK